MEGRAAHFGMRGQAGILTLTLIMTTSAVALAAQGRKTSIDLRTDAVITIVGSGKGNVAAAGDVNGDGVADALVSSCMAEKGAGAVYVLFGPFARARVNVTELKESGFAIRGGSPEDSACKIQGAGDVNGDGFDDVIVGAQGADNNARSLSGTAYVVFGKATTETVALADFDMGLQGMQGFRIDGSFRRDLAGASVGTVGEVNGDGLSDVVVGAPFAGTAYVVFGKRDPLPVDLLTFDVNAQGPAGFRIRTPTPNRSNGMAVAGAGDINGDEIADVIIGVIPTLSSTGSAFVIFGKADPLPIDARNITDGEGFKLKGTFSGSSTGHAVAGVGDINADGLDDVAVGAPVKNHCGRPSVYVVFGKRDSNNIRLKRLGRRGFEITDRRHCSELGTSVAAAGDLNEDGFTDLVVGANGASYKGRDGAGATYVLLGKNNTTTIKVGDMSVAHGYRIGGARAGDGSGLSVAALGDDVLVGAPHAGRSREGRAYVAGGIPLRKGGD